MTIKGHVEQGKRAKVLFGEAHTEIVTTEYVVLELGAHLSRSDKRPTFLRPADHLRREESMRVIPASTALLEAGIELFRNRPDKDWSLTDCISFEVMRQERIADALASDHHFTQAGFRILLSQD